MRLLPLLLAAAPTFAWDGLGHQTVGFLAAKYFNPATTSLISALAGLDGARFDIGDAAAWADTVRDRDNLPWSKNWHFINPRGDDPERGVCVLDFPSDCVGSNCIISAILNQTAIVLNTTTTTAAATSSAPRERGWVDEDLTLARRNATRFLLHFLGDLHQPLHTSGFKYGGTAVQPVCWGESAPCAAGGGGKERHLHGVWDADMPRKLRGLPEGATREEEKKAARTWAEDLYTRQQLVKKEEGGEEEECAELGGPRCVVRWAAESNRLVCSHVLKKGEAWILGHDLSGEYFVENAKLVDEQVGKAGLRLAGWMNAIATSLGASGADGWIGDDL